MFTGIVEEMGTLVAARQRAAGYEMTVRARIVLEGTRIGDSIAVDGACLTVTRLDKESFAVGLAPETLSRTGLGRLEPGARVNLERALTPQSRLGGHFVQGHIDGIGTIVDRRFDRESIRLTISLDRDLMRWVVPKGFVALDGTSLTVVDVLADRFSVMLVSHTQDHVTLSSKAVGDGVNVETDLIGKYVDRLLTHRADASSSGISRATLDEHGYV